MLLSLRGDKSSKQQCCTLTLSSSTSQPDQNKKSKRKKKDNLHYRLNEPNTHPQNIYPAAPEWTLFSSALGSSLGIENTLDNKTVWTTSDIISCNFSDHKWMNINNKTNSRIYRN